MKIFIGGSRGIKTLDRTVYCSLEAMYKRSIRNKEKDEILIGDADGVDYLVQDFYCKVKKAVLPFLPARENQGIMWAHGRWRV